MPTIGRAATKLPTGSSPAAQEIAAVDQDRGEERRGAADDIAGQRALHEGLQEIRPEDRQAVRDPRRDQRGRAAGSPAAPAARAPAAPRPPAPPRRRSAAPPGAPPALRMGAFGDAQVQPPSEPQSTSASATSIIAPPSRIPCREIPAAPGFSFGKILRGSRRQATGAGPPSARRGAHATPIRRSISRSISPSNPTSAAARIAAAKSADQICTVCP